MIRLKSWTGVAFAAVHALAFVALYVDYVRRSGTWFADLPLTLFALPFTLLMRALERRLLRLRRRHDRTGDRRWPVRLRARLSRRPDRGDDRSLCRAIGVGDAGVRGGDGPACLGWRAVEDALHWDGAGLAPSWRRTVAWVRSIVWVFLGRRRFAANTPIPGGWISLDFLGFSRPNRDLSMGYAA